MELLTLLVSVFLLFQRAFQRAERTIMQVLFCTCDAYSRVRWLFNIMNDFHVFEQAISSTLNDLGLVSLKKEQRQAVEALTRWPRSPRTLGTRLSCSILSERAQN